MNFKEHLHVPSSNLQRLRAPGFAEAPKTGAASIFLVLCASLLSQQFSKLFVLASLPMIGMQAGPSGFKIVSGLVLA